MKKFFPVLAARKQPGVPVTGSRDDHTSASQSSGTSSSPSAESSAIQIGPLDISPDVVLELESQPTGGSTATFLRPVPVPDYRAPATSRTLPESSTSSATADADETIVEEEDDDMSFDSDDTQGPLTKPVCTTTDRIKILSKESLLLRRKDWLPRQESESSEQDEETPPLVKRRKEARVHKRTDFDESLLKLYPWATPIRDEKNQVVGILCSICRRKAARASFHDYKLHCGRSQMKFLNVPFTSWGKAKEKLFCHEFGDMKRSSHPNATIQDLRKMCRERKLPTNAQHMTWYAEDYFRTTAEESGKDVRSLVRTGGTTSALRGREAISLLLSTLLKMIQAKDAVAARFRDEVEFQMLKSCSPKLTNWVLKNYTAHQSVVEFTDALYLATLYGVYKELTETACANKSDVVNFSVMLDLASTSHTRQWIAVCIKSVTKTSTPERLLCLLRSPKKDGESLMERFQAAIALFNNDMQRLFQMIPSLFNGEEPLKLLPENCLAFGSDGGGGARSKNISFNCRIKAHNCRCVDFWCGTHRCHLIAKNASKASDFLTMHFSVSNGIRNLASSSNELSQMMKNAQEATGECNNFRHGKPATMSDRAICKWESEWDMLAKESKLHLSINHFLMELRTSTKKVDSVRFNSHFLFKNACTSEHILAVALKLDILKVVVRLIRGTEVPGQDVESYRQAFQSAKSHFLAMNTSDGEFYANAKRELQSGKYVEIAQFRGDLQATVQYVGAKRLECINLFVTKLDEYFSKETLDVLKGFKLFSMDDFRLNVATEMDIYNYAKIEEDILLRIYCQPFEHVAKWQGDMNTRFTSPALGPPTQLREEILQYKSCVARSFLGHDPVTQDFWTTKDVLLKLLRMDATCVSEGTILRAIVKTYLLVPTSTAGVECVFSALKLTDGVLGRSRNDQTTQQLILISRESSHWKSFDTELAVDIWQKSKQRKLLIARGSDHKSRGKRLLKTESEKSKGRKIKCQRRQKHELKQLLLETRKADAGFAFEDCLSSESDSDATDDDAGRHLEQTDQSVGSGDVSVLDVDGGDDVSPAAEGAVEAL